MANSLPRTGVGKVLRIFAWASLIANISIIATGGAVRLTGSGLGCPTWPTCTPGSLIPTQELSWHSAIEFGNRMMTGVLGIIALVVLGIVLRNFPARRDLKTLAWVVLGGILAQAVVGGITVWTGLNPAIVGFHYVASIALVVVTTCFVYRMNYPLAARELAVPQAFAMLTHVVTAVLAVTILVGVITTANGPHSGDANVVRTGVDAALLAHFHAWPGYALVALIVFALLWAWRQGLPAFGWYAALLMVTAVQILVGVYQANFGLPAFAVGVHMVLAAITAALATVAVLKNKAYAV